MSLTPGTRLGLYEVVAKLGEGGMGEVYRARDVRLNRQVALKVLPAALADDPVRLRRLQREAQVLASLNHPQIATLHGLEESNGTVALVMELVEGEDLKQRLARGPIPLEEAMRIARQIALGLEAAHAQGIIHRDLKPANVKVRTDGAVKVLDFGLAKGQEAGGDDESPTMTASAALTTPGAVLGTAAYMSPEQARGLPADERSDIWAFGCVLFQMVTGRMAFSGPTLTDTLAAVLRAEPDWGALPDTAPPGIRLLLRRCVEKDPARRLHDIADARIEIDDATTGARQIETAPPARTARVRIAMTTVLVAVALAVGAFAGWAVWHVPAAPETHLEISTPPTTDLSLATFALSPDGRLVAFVATDNGVPKLWVRALDNPVARPLAGTEKAAMPFWSPDGKFLGFFADGQLKRMAAGGGPVETLASDAQRPRGAAWAPDGSILYATGLNHPLRRIAASGGEAGDVTRVESPKEDGHSYPQFLPGGRFIYFVAGIPEIAGVYLGDLDGTRKTRLVEADGPAIYTDPGYLVFARDGHVLAQRFDAGSGTMRGDVLTLGSANDQTFFSASSTATFAYRTSPEAGGQRQLLWVDRSGREFERVEYPAGNVGHGPALSRDGQSVVVHKFSARNEDLWKYDRHRALWDRLTYDPGEDYFAVWSHDDRSIIYSAVRNGAPLSLYKRLVIAPPESEQLLFTATKGHPAFANDLSADEKILLFTSLREGGNSDIWALPLDSAAKPFEVVATAANETSPEFSRDGNWIAYQSNKLGSDEVFIRPFPGPGPDTRVSPNGGTEPRWNPTGGELFYIGKDDAMMAVKIVFNPGGTAAIGKPQQLFPSGQTGLVRAQRARPQYCVSPDGKWFVINSGVSVGNVPLSTPPIQLVLNWKPGR